MYESYWQLSTRPFEDAADQRLYYPSEGHQGALLKLRYAIENRRSGALLVGAPGLGKTLLIRTLARQLPAKEFPFVQLLFPQLAPSELVAYITEELTGVQPLGTPTDRYLRRLQGYLAEIAREGKHLVLVFEEAHLLRESSNLETIRLLMNFEHQAVPAMTVLLVGQPSLLPALRRLPELEERLDAKCLLHRLNIEETISYIQHRLSVAGAAQPIFEDAALEAIYHLSQGTPRRINRLGDLALLLGYAEELTLITARHIDSLAEEMLVSSND